jgi:rhodanese-related sulfurtransferase
MTTSQLLAIALAVAAWYFFFRHGKTSSAEVHRLVQAGARLLDVRTPGEFAGGHLPGALNVPLDQLDARAPELARDPAPVVVYCASGMRSAQAKRVLKGAGLAEVHDLGGMGRW